MKSILQKESNEIDKDFGLEVMAIERMLYEKAIKARPEGNHKTWGRSLHQGNQTWVGLNPDTLQTPYSELQEICELLELKEGDHLVDLGAGYGRMGMVVGLLYEGVRFSGYEYVSERVCEGNRVMRERGFTDSCLYEGDLNCDQFILPEAEYYFLYDYGEVGHIRKTLGQLSEMSLRKSIKVVARGKGSRSLIQYEHPWLSDVYPAIHREHFSIYSSAG